MAAEITAQGLRWGEPHERQEGEMNEVDCAKAQTSCREKVYAAMLPRWVAYVIVGLGTGIIGACFGLAMLSRSEAGEASKTAACQARDIEHLAAGQTRIEARLEKIQELLEKK